MRNCIAVIPAEAGIQSREVEVHTARDELSRSMGDRFTHLLVSIAIVSRVNGDVFFTFFYPHPGIPPPLTGEGK